MRRITTLAILLAPFITPGCGGGGGGDGGTSTPPVPVIEFTATAFAASEAAGTVTITARRTVGDAATSVTYATSNGTASATDYTAAGGLLSWAAGDFADKSFNVTIAADAVAEGSETVILTLSAPTGGATLGASNPATLTISDGPGTIRFQAGAISVNESGSAIVSVERVNGAGGAASVSYATSNGSAGASDYTAAAGTLSWADGEIGAKTFSVVTAADALAEGSETVVLTLSGAVGATLSGTNPATLTILDNPGTIRFLPGPFSVNESASATITVERIGGSGGAVGANYATSNGSAGASDYASASGTLSWSDGDSSSKTFNVTTSADVLAEGAETVTLTLSSVTGGAALGGTNPATLTVVDSAGTLRFTTGASSVGEGGGTATIFVERAYGAGGAVGVTWSTANGTATTSDYTAASSTLSWADGETAMKSFTLTITQDALVEGGETVLVSLSAATGGASITGTNPATLTIIDDDSGGTLQFSTAAYVVSEAGATATITVTRAGGSAGAVSVNYGDAGGGSAGGADYLLAGGTLNWPASDMTPKTFNVTILNDAISDDNETVNLVLSGATGATLGTPSAATLTIVEPPVVTMASPFSGATNISLATHLKLTFSKPMDILSVQDATSLAPATTNPLLFYWNAAQDQLTIAFDTTSPAGIEGDDLLVQNTTYTVTIAASAMSATAIPLASATSTSFTTKVDATPPSIVSITPDPAAVLTSPVTQFVITFNEPMLNSGYARLKYGIDAVWAEASVGAPTATMTMTWTTPTTLTLTLLGTATPLAANRAYNLSLGSLQDAAWNWLEFDERLVVTQGSDTVAPTVTGMLPANGATNVSRDTGIILAFSEAMNPTLPAHVTISGAGATLYDVKQETIAMFIVPRRAWPASATIQVTIDNGATDASGNAISTTTFSFTTAAADATPMVVDAGYSTLIDGLTNIDEGGLGEWSVRFKHAISGARVYLDEQDLAVEDISIVEQTTGIPLKGYWLRIGRDSAALEIRNNWIAGGVSLQPNTTYVVTLKASVKNSSEIGLATTQLSFTTAAAGANHRPKFDWLPESQCETSSLGQSVGYRTSIRNGWTTPDAGDTLTVTVTSSVDSPTYSAALIGPSPFGGEFTYATPAATDEANFGTPGWHTLTYSTTDGTFTATLKDDIFVFDATQFPTLNTSGAQATNTPTLTWGALPADAQAVVLQISDSTGKEVYTVALAPGTTSFTLPADQALATGSYTWQLLMVRFTKGDAVRIGVVPGFGIVDPSTISVP